MNLPAEVEAAAKRSGFSGAEYNHVARTARLVTVQLLKLDFDAHPERLSDGDELRLSFERDLVSCRFDQETGAAAAVFRYAVRAKAGRAKAFACVAEYAVLYRMDDNATPEASISFCKHVGSFAAYPYFRAVAAQMAWNAGMELPPLPTISAMPVVPDAKKVAGADQEPT